MKYFFVLIYSLTISCSVPNDDPSTGGGQTGEEEIGCLPVKTHVIDRDHQSPLGFTATALLSTLTLTGTTAMIWEDRPESVVEITIRDTGTFEFVEYEWVDETNQKIGPAIGNECYDLFEVSVEIQIKTTDGFLDEMVQTRLVATKKEKGSIALNIHASDIQGSFDFSTYGPLKDIDTWMQIEITAAGLGGVFRGSLAERHGDFVSAERLEFGSW